MTTRRPEPISMDAELVATNETTRYKIQAIDGYFVEVFIDMDLKDSAGADITATLYERVSGRALKVRNLSLTADKYLPVSMSANFEVPPNGYAVIYVGFSAILDIVNYSIRVLRRELVME